MTSWIEPPPKQKGMGCLGKGCLMIVIFLVLLVLAFVIGGYTGIRYVVTSPKPKEIPQAQTSEDEQNAVRDR
jgi:Na+-transporting methylmalonyl-CoA/oxaloacetate decarboxylase gamma subunit